MMGSTKILIDGDWIAYSAGFAGQKTHYMLPCSGDVYDNISELRAKTSCDWPVDKIFTRVIPDPKSHVLHSAKKMLGGVLSVMEKRYGSDISPIIYIDGPGNFRDELAYIKPYKGNRTTAKPVYLEDIRQYLRDWCHRGNANYVEARGIESDDAMAMDMTLFGPVNCVCVAVDKDMLQVPGLHYNPNKKGFKKVSELEGLQRLYIQAAAGDPADNIGGVYKIGQKKAQAIFRSLDDEMTMWNMLCKLYAESLSKYGPDVYNGFNDPPALALENMRLVYLRRTVIGEKLWLPPDVRKT